MPVVYRETVKKEERNVNEWLKTFPKEGKTFQPFYFFANFAERPLTVFKTAHMLVCNYKKQCCKNEKQWRKNYVNCIGKWDSICT